MTHIKTVKSRCGKCRHFIEHICPRNDLYLTPKTFVQDNFASGCNEFKPKLAEVKV